jgi:uncharacterized protein
MIAVAVIMESPAILTGLLIAHLATRKQASVSGDATAKAHDRGELVREVLFNGSVLLLVGAFVIGLITGQKGMTRLDPFVNDIFQGVLCLFLLEMGLVAGRRIFQKDGVHVTLAIAALISTLIGAALAFLGARLIGATPGDTAILMTLGASASYIAVPAAMRVAMPDANPGVYLTASLGVTFPFNIILGLPLYFWIASQF